MFDCCKADYLNLNISISVIPGFTHSKKKEKGLANLVCFNEALGLTGVKAGC